MSAERDPLPYLHKRGPAGSKSAWACTLPENDQRGGLSVPHHSCPGCRAFAMAVAVRDPDTMGLSTSGKRVRFIDSIRHHTDDFDPARVLFERALRERGIA